MKQERPEIVWRPLVDVDYRMLHDVSGRRSASDPALRLDKPAAIGVVAYSSRSLVPTFRLSWRLALAVLIVTGITAMQWLPTWYWLQATSQPPVISTSNAALDNVPTLLQALHRQLTM